MWIYVTMMNVLTTILSKASFKITSLRKMRSLIVLVICLSSVLSQWTQPYVNSPQQTWSAVDYGEKLSSWSGGNTNTNVAPVTQSHWSGKAQVSQTGSLPREYQLNGWKTTSSYSSPAQGMVQSQPGQSMNLENYHTSQSYPISSESSLHRGVTVGSESTTTEFVTKDQRKEEVHDEKGNETKNANPGCELKQDLSENEYEKTLLTEINKYRFMHGAAQLLTNTLLERKAKNWAKKMAAADREFLDVNSPHGQLTFSGPSGLTPNVQVAAARHWYNRIKNYAWDEPAISTKSIQFTQLIWAGTKQVGVGIANNCKSQRSYVAAYFAPKGNDRLHIAENVYPVTATRADKGADNCPTGWHRIKKRCYRYFNNNVKWSEAVNLCDDEQSSLLAIESSDEEITIKSILAKDEGTEAWIGLSDRVHPDTKNMIWVDGSPITYSNWYAYQDNKREERMCATLSIVNGGWMYRPCSQMFGFICKKRIKGIVTYWVSLNFPEKFWSDNLKNEESLRYKAMKRHLENTIMNLYADDDWFVDMSFEGFSQSPDDKILADFKITFSPDGDAPSDPLKNLRTKLESNGLVEGEKTFIQNASLLEDD